MVAFPGTLIIFAFHSGVNSKVIKEYESKNRPVPDTLFIKAVSVVPEADLLDFDKDKLEEMALKHGAELTVESDSITFSKNWEDSLSSNENFYNAGQLQMELKELTYMNREKVEKGARRYKLYSYLVSSTFLISIFIPVLIVLFPVFTVFTLLHLNSAIARKYSNEHQANLKDPEFIRRRRNKNIIVLLLYFGLLLAGLLILLSLSFSFM